MRSRRSLYAPIQMAFDTVEALHEYPLLPAIIHPLVTPPAFPSRRILADQCRAWRNCVPALQCPLTAAPTPSPPPPPEPILPAYQACAPTPPDEGTPLTIEALERFVETDAKREGPRLARNFLASAKARGIAQADALDAIQNRLVRVVKRIGTGEANSVDISPAHLFVSGMNDAIRAHVRSKKVVPVDGTDNRAIAVWRQERRQEVRAAMLACVTEALDSLPKADRVLLTTCVIEDRPLQEAARLLRIRPGTAGQRLPFAIERLGRAVIHLLLLQEFARDELPVIPDLLV